MHGRLAQHNPPCAQRNGGLRPASWRKRHKRRSGAVATWPRAIIARADWAALVDAIAVGVVYGTKRELSGPANGEFGEAQRNSEAYGAGSITVADYAALIRPAVFRFAIRTCKWRILSALSTLISGSPDFAENSNPRSYASRGHVSCNNAARPASLARRSIGLRRWPPQHGYIPSTRYPGVVGPASRVAVRLQDARA